jgi:Raf kinase inhibitor-like YbhB/YbcL family protein
MRALFGVNTQPQEEPMAFQLTSPAFAPGGKIPRKYTGEGENISPPLAWLDPPTGTTQFALVVDDPDAPMAQPFVHWVHYQIPGSDHALGEGDQEIGVDGQNGKRERGWTGPMPPPGHGVHHYHFRLFALANEVPMDPGATKSELLVAIRDQTLGQAELIGTYERARATTAQG